MITLAQIRKIAGPLTDEVAEKIEQVGATEADLIEAVGWHCQSKLPKPAGDG